MKYQLIWSNTNALRSFLYFVTLINCASSVFGKEKGYQFNTFPGNWILMRWKEKKKYIYLKKETVDFDFFLFYPYSIWVCESPSSEESLISFLWWRKRSGTTTHWVHTHSLWGNTLTKITLVNSDLCSDSFKWVGRRLVHQYIELWSKTLNGVSNRPLRGCFI